MSELVKFAMSWLPGTHSVALVRADFELDDKTGIRALPSPDNTNNPIPERPVCRFNTLLTHATVAEQTMARDRQGACSPRSAV
eukprot:14637311-Alexandrium_andersonii.AAC.1